jgi:uncharacterized protein
LAVRGEYPAKLATNVYRSPDARGAISTSCDHVIATLRGHELELRASGVMRRFVFGSTARVDACPDSDIDQLASFDESRRLSLLDLVGIELRLAGLLGKPVDLVEEGKLKPRVQRSV